LPAGQLDIFGGMMNVTYKGDHGLKVSVTNADRQVMRVVAQKVRDQWNEELEIFINEIRATMRKMEPGQSITVISKPLTCEMTMERDDAST
jgi:hypothetical protein